MVGKGEGNNIDESLSVSSVRSREQEEEINEAGDGDDVHGKDTHSEGTLGE